MNKNCFILTVTALFIALSMSQSVMANDGMFPCKTEEICIINDTIKSDVSYRVSNEKVNFPQGFYLQEVGYWFIKFPDGTEIIDDNLSYEKIENLVGIRKMGKPSVKDIIFPKSVGNLSDDEVTKLIKEKLSIIWPDYDFNTNDYLHYNNSFNLSYYYLDKPSHIVVSRKDADGGYFFDGHFYSRKTLEKRKDAKEAGAKKDIKTELAKFKKKYGFDPSVNDVRYIVKVGRNILHIVDARNAWVQEYGDRFYKITVSLVKDQGTNKCYKFFWHGHFCGFFWVRNNVITSISWA